MRNWNKIGVALLAVLLLVAPISEAAVSAKQSDVGKGKSHVGTVTSNSQEVLTTSNNSSKSLKVTTTEAERLAEVLIDLYGVSGVQYAIRKEGQIVLSGGLGIDETGSKMEIASNVMFPIGSVSKMYVTAATMMLADSGKVDIDAVLTNYIPEFAMADERYKRITPRMLMNHSAGLYGSHYRNSSLFADNSMDNQSGLLESLKSQRLKSEPGEYSVYENDGFQLLEILVERVSGMSYSEFLDQSISKPLGLSSTKTPLDTFDRNRIYPIRLPGAEGVLPVESTNVIGTGGLYSTAQEVTLFSDVLIGERPELLSKTSALAMQKREYLDGIWVKGESSNIFGYGLGWDAVDLAPFDAYGIKAVTKGGDTNLYHSALIALPEERVSIALLTAGGSSLFNTAAASNILLTYLKEVGEISSIEPNKTFDTPVKQEMPDYLYAYSGLYGKVGATQTITIEDGEVKLPNMVGIIPEQNYVYTGNNAFTSEDGRTQISFEEQSNGHIYLRVKSTLDFPEIGQSKIDYYELQRLVDNTLNDHTKYVWKERNGKTYYAVNEKINSLSYLLLQLLSKTIQLDKSGGYASGALITDENNAVNYVEIPVMNGRDAYDLSFYYENGVEYLQASDWTFISEDAIKPIYNGKASIVTIQNSGHARWFRIGDDVGGRIITVDHPESSGFVIFDASGMPLHISAISNSNTAVLPEGGFIVFGGTAGDVFEITLELEG